MSIFSLYRFSILTWLTPYDRYSCVRNSHAVEEIQNTITTRQTDIASAITTADRQLIVLENKMEELDMSDPDHEEDASERDKAEALGQMQQAHNALDTSRKLLNELLSKSQEEAVMKATSGKASHSTSVTFGDNNSGLQAGTINGALSGISFGRK